VAFVVRRGFCAEEMTFAMQIFTRSHEGTELGFCALEEPPEGGTSLTSQNVRGANRLRAQCLIGEALDAPARGFI
jgi:hypothetical protein